MRIVQERTKMSYRGSPWTEATQWSVTFLLCCQIQRDERSSQPSRIVTARGHGLRRFSFCFHSRELNYQFFILMANIYIPWYIISFFTFQCYLHFKFSPGLRSKTPFKCSPTQSLQNTSERCGWVWAGSAPGGRFDFRTQSCWLPVHDSTGFANLIQIGSQSICWAQPIIF